VWIQSTREPIVDPSRWVQLTAFPDSATQPALSADGRTLAFIRGPNTFTTTGQIYVKPLPAGQAVPLTGDDFVKMSPVFSPDARRIAYTVNSHAEPWATWIVPVRGGMAERYMANASGLTWTRTRGLLFSALKPTGPSHMAIVRSDASGPGRREVFAPAHTGGMAHRSALSPDGRWVILAEMDERGVWTPCRLVPSDGTSPGSLVGPAPGRCTDVAWGPDGRTMYFTADAGDGFHLWRQRFPDGAAEQITRGPTAEEGLAIAPDGRSVITSVGLRRRGIWIRDASGERQLSGEGYAFWPLLTRDGRTIVYRLSSSVASGQTPTELWKMDVASGRTERLLPGLLVTQYDLAADNRIVAAVADRDGSNHLWLASVDGSVAARPIPGAEGDNPRFIAHGDITFRVNDGSATYVVRIRENGDGRTRLAQSPGGSVFGSASPDGEWLSANSRDARGNQVMTVFSMSGEHDPVPILGGRGGALVSRLRWSADGTRAYLSIQLGEASAFGTGRTYVLPLRAGTTLPDVPPGGFQSESEVAALPGVEMLPFGDVTLGQPGTYLFSRETVTRNLYSVPLP
jgi:eukaryotic-like serine/threonine-protein kinase